MSDKHTSKLKPSLTLSDVSILLKINNHCNHCICMNIPTKYKLFLHNRKCGPTVGYTFLSIGAKLSQYICSLEQSYIVSPKRKTALGFILFSDSIKQNLQLNEKNSIVLRFHEVQFLLRSDGLIE